MEVLLKIYMPFILGIIFILFSCKKNIKFESRNLPVELFGVIKIDLPVWNVIILRVILILCGVGSLMLYFFIDYSTLFPKKLSMQVFYDKAGITQTLADYSTTDIISYKVSTNVELRDSVYFKNLDKEIRNFKISDTFFCRKNGNIHSEGKTSFYVEKVSGFQTYHLTEADGEVTHTIECPGENALTVTSYFSKISTVYDYIHPSFKEIILKPEFKQIIAENRTSQGVKFNHILHGLTQVKLFPYPTYGRTLYLFEYKDSLYPIGYAVYSE